MSVLEIRDAAAPAAVMEAVAPQQTTDAQVLTVVRATLDVLGVIGFDECDFEARLIEEFDLLLPYTSDVELPAVGINLQASGLEPQQLMRAFNAADTSLPKLYVDEVYTYPALQAQDWDFRLPQRATLDKACPLFAMAISAPLGERLDWDTQQQLQQDAVHNTPENLQIAPLTQADWILYNAAARHVGGVLPRLDDMAVDRTFTRFVQYPLQHNGQGFSADISEGEAGLGDTIPDGLPGGSFRVITMIYPK